MRLILSDCFPTNIESQYFFMLDGIEKLPEVIVFDLDDTLWVGEVDCTGGPPFRKVRGSRHTIHCKNGSPVTLFGSVPSIFDALVDNGIRVAYASRTWTPRWAEQALESFECGTGELSNMWSASVAQGWGDCSKTKHMNEIAISLSLKLDSMVFFDNEMRNIRDINPLGSVCGYCPDGLTDKVFIATLEKYSDTYRKHKE